MGQDPDMGVPPVGDRVCGELPAPAAGTCDVTAGSDDLLIRGTLLGPAGLLVGGELLINARGIIQCVDCDCSGRRARPPRRPSTVARRPSRPASSTPTITSPSPRTPPGTGATSATSTGMTGAAARAATPASRCRATPATPRSRGASCARSWRHHLARGLGRGQRPAAQPRLRPGGPRSGRRRPRHLPAGRLGRGAAARRVRLPGLPARSVLMAPAWSPHVSEGIDPEARNEFVCLSTDAGIDVIGQNGALIHGVGLTAPDGELLASRGASVIWSPRSNISLYGNTAPVTMLAHQGVLIGIGTDWTASGSINLPRELACADQLNSENFGGFFTDRDLWLMATRNNAAALQVLDGVGSLAPGLAGDIAIYGTFPGQDPYRAVIESTAGTTALVLRSGTPLYGDANIMAAIPDGQQGCEPIGDVCGVAKAACIQREIGSSFAVLSAGNDSAYPLYFCGAPAGEPSCRPFRPMEYTEGPTPDDRDGDGLPNAADNCPDIFNPVRPVDRAGQADHDLDGEGDACDVCPLNPDTADCSPPDPDDRDADGVTDAQDNCPGIFNPGQEDGDGDGRGDTCDACPAANPGNEPCPRTIYDIKGAGELDGLVARVSGVVTAVSETGNFFMQVPEGAPHYAGPDFSGIYVFMGNASVDPAPVLARGDLVTLTGTAADFFGQVQLGRITALTVDAQGQALPAPVVVEPADVATGAARALRLEAALVRVNDVEVTEIEPPAGAGDRAPTGEFVVDNALRINDFLYAIDPLPAVGARLDFVVGALRFANENSKLEPRGPEDVGTGPPEVIGLGPADTYLRVGEERVPTNPAGRELWVELSGPALDGGQPVEVRSAAGAVLVAAPVVVPAGERFAPVRLRGVAQAAAVEITASIAGRGQATASVRVLGADEGPGELRFSPADVTVGPGGEAALRVVFDLPAPPAGLVLGFEGMGLVDPPAAIPVPGDATEIEFTVTAPDAAGDYPVAVTLADLRAEGTVTVRLGPPPGDDLVINEIDYDQPGADGAEFVEIMNPTAAAIPLAGVRLEAVNGSGGAVYGTYNLSDAGAMLAPGGYLVIGVAAVRAALPAGTLSLDMPANGLQNGAPDGVRLMRGNAFVDGLAYEGAMAGVGEGMPGIADPGEGSLVRCPDGADSGDNANDFVLVAAPTPGAPNACQ
ncbi:MAG: lamin tail domain-containing protein [bacterium]